MATIVKELIPFRAEHLLAFVHRDSDYMESLESALEKEKKGPAYTGVYDGIIVGCAGVIIHWPGFGTAWTVLSKEALSQPFWLTRIIRRNLQDIISTFRLHRVEMVVLADSDVNIQWAKALGFRREYGRAEKYTVDKRDILRFEIVEGMNG